jgi:predicted transcriptional regulator
MTAESNTTTSPTGDLIGCASAIVAAYLSRNPIALSDLPAMIKSVHGALLGASGASTADSSTAQKPAVPVKKSVMPDYLVCLEDGRKCKTLKRYLRGRFNLTPDEYRAKWGLPRDYPMVAPNYAERRSQLAKQNGLGRRPSAKPTKKRPARRA